MTPDERLGKTITLLESIDRSLKQLVAQLARYDRREAPLKALADDRDLDGEYGDPEVKVDPRDWAGATMKGRRLSECPPDYLDLLAELYDYFALKADEKGETTTAGKPVALYKRKDAARARGWARRLRASGGPVAAPETPSWVESEWVDEVPF